MTGKAMKAKMSKPGKTPALVKRVARKPQPKPLTREQAMDIAAAKTNAEMDAVNNDKSIEYRIMNERDPMNPLAPVPSERNSASQGVQLNDMTFSRAGETQYGNSNFMRARRRI
jgi:hypothetical protein